jgi:hypothetical protein
MDDPVASRPAAEQAVPERQRQNVAQDGEAATAGTPCSDVCARGVKAGQGDGREHILGTWFKPHQP